MENISFKIPGKAAFDSLTSYLPFFEESGVRFYEYDSVYHSYHPKVIKFVDDFYSQGFEYPFDWTKWTDDFWELSNDRDKFETADIETVIKFLSTIVNADRFIDGTMAYAIDNGHISSVLKKFLQYSESLNG